MRTPTTPWRRMAAGLLIGGLLAAIPASSQADEPYAPATPGLPHIVCTEKQKLLSFVCRDGDAYRNGYSWTNVTQLGLTGSIPAKQWGRIPLTMIAANLLVYQTDINITADPGGLLYKAPINADTFLVSPAGSAHSYGDSALIPIRTVAFGSIPVTVTLQVSQRRDSDDLPRPIRLDTIEEKYQVDSTGYQTTVVAPSYLDEMVSVRVRSVVVDGVDVRLRDTCQTGPVARLRTESDRQDLVIAADGSTGTTDDIFDPDTGFYGLSGGTLNGTIDIPAFSGCATQSGDDLSPLLTSAISSTGNPVTLRIGAAFSCYFNDGFSYRPVSPGINTPDGAGCVEINNPNNPKIRTVPYPLDIPTYAPGTNPGR